MYVMNATNISLIEPDGTETSLEDCVLDIEVESGVVHLVDPISGRGTIMSLHHIAGVNYAIQGISQSAPN